MKFVFPYSALALAAVFLLHGCGGGHDEQAASEVLVQTVAVPDGQGGTATMLLPDFIKLVEQEGGAVVSIQASRDEQAMADTGMPLDGLPENDPFYEFFKRLQPHADPAEQEDNHNFGSGFIISPDGYILTNTHVLSGMDNIKVVLNDRREYRAVLVGSDTQSDVALLKIDAQNLQVVKIGDVKALRVGEWVAAIGAPFGFDNSVTAGIVSAKGRSLPNESHMTPFIQTDVAINPGNSGGPLFNLKGQVVGINSQIYSQSGGFMGISFAIPIDVAMSVAEQLRTTGKVQRARIGVVIQEVSYDLAKSFGLQSANGALIAEVMPDGPAAQVGLKPGDIVLSVNGEAVKSSNDLPVLVGMMPPGTTLTLGIWRDGKQQDVAVVLAASQENHTLSARESLPEYIVGEGGGFAVEQAGLQLLPTAQGLAVIQAGGPAQRAGLRRGDVVLMVDRQPVHDKESFLRALGEAHDTVALLVRRGDSKVFVALDLRG